MKSVFDPWSLGTLRLRNRIIRSATHEGMAHRDGMPTDDLVGTWRKLAAGGAGAIITGYAGVRRSRQGTRRSCWKRCISRWYNSVRGKAAAVDGRLPEKEPIA
jgi:2,4-dienoyl-CoA reductase-like NADH-dependent reductase (Old Yellow Enzyme family)